MATNEKMKITPETKLSELTVGDLQRLIGEATQKAMYDLLWELEAYLPDPDESKELKPEFAQKLREFIDNKDRGELKTLDEVSRKLGLDE
jgi:hypothetical protein